MEFGTIVGQKQKKSPEIINELIYLFIIYYKNI